MPPSWKWSIGVYDWASTCCQRTGRTWWGYADTAQVSTHQVARRERDISYPPDMTQGICGMCTDDYTASQTTVETTIETQGNDKQWLTQTLEVQSRCEGRARSG
eukprot:g33524.t1